MNALEQAVQLAIDTKGEQKAVNKAYLEFIKANFMIPIEREDDESLAPKVLFLEEGNTCFLPVFSSQPYFDVWAEDIKDAIAVLKLSGVDLLKGVGDGVEVALNIGSPYQKIFHSAEIERMRSMVLKIFK
ncbi:MAG: SseB family protein [Methylococcales bacterium]|nr:SseB family protein [Methylococcales bacterium]